MKIKAHDLSYVLFLGNCASPKIYSDLAQKILSKDTYAFADFFFCTVSEYKQKYIKDTESNIVYADKYKLLNALEKIAQYGNRETFQSYLDFLSHFSDSLIAERLRGIYTSIRKTEYRGLIINMLCSLKGLDSIDETKLIKFSNGITGLKTKLYPKRFPLIDFANWKTGEVFSYLASNNSVDDRFAVNILTKTKQQMSCFAEVVGFLSNRKNNNSNTSNEKLVKHLLKIDRSIPQEVQTIAKFCHKISRLDNETKFAAIHKLMYSLLDYPLYAFKSYADYLQKYAKLSENYIPALALMEKYYTEICLSSIAHEEWDVARKMTYAYLDFLTREVNKKEPGKQAFDLFDSFVAHLNKYGNIMLPKEHEAVTAFLLRHVKKIGFAGKLSDVTIAMIGNDASLDPLIWKKWFHIFPEHICHLRYRINCLAAFNSVLKIYTGTNFPIKKLAKEEIIKIINLSSPTDSLGDIYAERLAEADLLNLKGLPEWMTPFLQEQKELLKKQKLVLNSLNA